MKVTAKGPQFGICVLLTLVSLKGADLAIRAQFLVMGAIGLSLLSFFVGRAPNPPGEIAWTPGSTRSVCDYRNRRPPRL